MTEPCIHTVHPVVVRGRQQAERERVYTYCVRGEQTVTERHLVQHGQSLPISGPLQSQNRERSCGPSAPAMAAAGYLRMARARTRRRLATRDRRATSLRRWPARSCAGARPTTVTSQHGGVKCKLNYVGTHGVAASASADVGTRARTGVSCCSTAAWRKRELSHTNTQLGMLSACQDEPLGQESRTVAEPVRCKPLRVARKRESALKACRPCSV